jgi:TolB-like protein/Tfp pilus assembly protein PilF
VTGNLFGELRRRNVIRAAGLYLVGAWLLVQVSATVLPLFDVPAWIARAVVVALAVGFVPAMAVAWVFEWTPQGLKRDAELPPAQAAGNPQGARRLDRLIIVVLALGLGYFALDKFVLQPARSGTQAAVAAASAAGPKAPGAAKAQEQSIAVLPFSNLSADPEQAFFSDGLSEDLITSLSQLGGLKVISRNSSFHFRDSKLDATAIGKALGVARLLSGSVRRDGGQVRISAELTDVADGRTLWSKNYDRAYAGLFKLQDEITAAVAGELKARLLSPAAAGAVAQDERPPSGNLEAYNATLQGRFYVARNNADDYKRAITELEHAIALDPAYARAHATLATALVLDAAVYLGGAEAQAAVARARKEVDIALRLAPDLAFAHTVNSLVLSNGELRWVQAEAESRRAVELAPNDAEALAVHSQDLTILGDMRGSAALARRALALDPLNATTWFWLSCVELALGRMDAAADAAQRAHDLQPTSAPGQGQLAIVDLVRGDTASAIRRARAMDPGVWRDITLAITTQKGPDRAEADRTLQHLIATAGDQAAYQVAQAYAVRGDADKVFEWLERAWANRDPGLRRLLSDAMFAPYRADPRFVALRKTIGLAP